MNDYDGISMIAEWYFYTGMAYLSEGKYAQALDVYNKVLEMIQELNASTDSILLNISEAKYYLGANYAFQGEDEKAIKYYKESLDIKRNYENVTGVKLSMADILFRLGAVFQRANITTEAISYYGGALDIYDESASLGDLGVSETKAWADTYYHLGSAYQADKQHAEAIKAFDSSIITYNKLNDSTNRGHIADIYFYIGSSNHYLLEYREALKYYNLSLGLKEKLRGEGENIGNVPIELVADYKRKLPVGE